LVAPPGGTGATDSPVNNPDVATPLPESTPRIPVLPPR
jgi:hypothetical protein